MTKPESSSARGALRVGMALLGLALAVTGCSSAGGKTAGSGPADQAVVGMTDTFHGTIYVSSQVNGQPSSWHVIKTFVDRMADIGNCATLAKKGDLADGDFLVPSGQAPEPTDSIVVTDFRGPGTYPPATLKNDKSDSIYVTEKAGQLRYDITTSAKGATPGKEVLFLDADGSGEVVYSEAHLDGAAKEPAVAGLISWSCTS
ncbi:MAG TPA: hypothetical protein VEL03_18695 [Streptosporangiaceae bacterium]|nr:hypothetical protein [Streptosporangiaceae bacterium]